MKRIMIKKTALGFDREPLLQPFGFKGGYVRELWNSAVVLESDNNMLGLGLGVQSVLWSDAEVFASFTPTGGNALMLMLTEYALKLIKGQHLSSPIDMLEDILPEVMAYARMLTGSVVQETFVLNALVPIDMALWRLYAAENGITSFDGLVPEFCVEALAIRQPKLGSIPLVPYGMSLEDVSDLAREGHFVLKIKIGSDSDKDGDREKMLAWDKERLLQIYNATRDFETPYTEDGGIAFYLDANGRYDTKERLLDFLDYADKIGCLNQIILFEEPFHDKAGIDVSDVPVRVAADESAHNAQDVERLIDEGYSAFALKPIAKTLSRSFKMLEITHRYNIPCFCADLTVNPLMVEWNKNVSARLSPLPGVNIGVLESNGGQNYTNWKKMTKYHPCGDAPWVSPHGGVFELSGDFYNKSGGIFLDAPHYTNITR